MNREHIIIGCIHAAAVWNEVNPMINMINSANVYNFKSIIKIMERKYKSNHVPTSLDSIQLNSIHEHNMANIVIIEIIASAMQSLLSTWFKYIDLALAIINANDNDKPEQQISLNKFTDTYENQIQPRLYLKACIYALPKHSMRYDALLAYNPCYGPDKQK